MRIDHVIYATHDLDAAAARIEAELGVAVLPGGRHDGLGTHNRIVALAGTYIELLAVHDAEEAAGSQLGRALLQRIERVGEGLMGWAAAVDDVQQVASRLGTEVITVTRQGRTGYLTGLRESLQDPYLPFFLTRDPSQPHPGDSEHGQRAIEWVEVTGDVARLELWLNGSVLPARIATGPPAVKAIGVGAHVFS